MKYTEEQANERLATTVLGWEYTYKSIWNPLKDANQALQALELWRQKDKKRMAILHSTQIGCYVTLITVDGKCNQEELGKMFAKSLTHAIVTAILSAIDGEQATIEEV